MTGAPRHVTRPPCARVNPDARVVRATRTNCPGDRLRHKQRRPGPGRHCLAERRAYGGCGCRDGRRTLRMWTSWWWAPGSPGSTCSTGSRELGFSTVVLDAAADVGGHVVLEPISRGTVRHPDHRLRLQLRSRARARLDLVREVRHPAGDPVVPGVRGRPLRPSPRHRVLHPRRVRRVGRDRRAAGACARTAGESVRCRFYVMASGCLSLPKAPDIAGHRALRGESYATSRWPHEDVDFTGKRVAVIGTGSSGIQSIPLIAAQAAQLTVFQRTANFSIPARNGPPSAGAARSPGLRPGRLPRRGQAVPGRRAPRGDRRSPGRTPPRRCGGTVRGGVGSRRADGDPRRLQRPSC